MRSFFPLMILLIMSLSLQARPAPSYWKFDRVQLSAPGYTLVLSEHIFETRPIYYTVKILTDDKQVVAEFSRCSEVITRNEHRTIEQITCEKNSEQIKVSFLYDSVTTVDALWSREGVETSFVKPLTLR